MRIGEVGEFPLIDILAQMCPKPPDEVVVGIGDDAAVWRAKGLSIATTDSLVEGIHFRLDLITFYELGWKALAVNLSDIAAMGGTPKYALVSLCLAPHLELDSVKELYQGLVAIASQFDTFIAGGNVTSSPGPLMITVALYGAALDKGGQEAPLMLRSAARPGDLIGVTGRLGASAAALKAMLNHWPVDEELRAVHFRPQPRVREGQLLALSGVKCGIDISDGLAGDLWHICEASGVKAQIYGSRLPIDDRAKDLFPDEAFKLALGGGEDYELLFTAPPDTMKRATDILAKEHAAPATVIGEVVSQGSPSLVVLGEDGTETDIRELGYDHFRRRK